MIGRCRLTVNSVSGALALLLAAFALATPMLATAMLPATAAESGTLDTLRSEALTLVNAARQDRGLPSLSLTARLNAAAQAHAEDMLKRGYYAHQSPEGETVGDRYRERGGGRWKAVAENIAECQGCRSPLSAERVRQFHRGWMNSPSHRDNIVGQGFDGFGFGIAGGDDGRIYAVQTFAGAGASSRSEPGEASAALDAEAHLATALVEVNRAREGAAAGPVAASEQLSGIARLRLPKNLNEPLFGRSGGEIRLPSGVPANAWRSLDLMVGACGACGAVPSGADIRDFTQRWLADPDYRSRLLHPDATHLGFVLRASGEGRKVAVLVIGRRNPRLPL